MARVLHVNACCCELLCIIHHLTLSAPLSPSMSLISPQGCVWAHMSEILRPDYKLKTRWNVKHVCPNSLVRANNYIPSNCTVKHESTALTTMRAKYLNGILTYENTSAYAYCICYPGRFIFFPFWQLQQSIKYRVCKWLAECKLIIIWETDEFWWCSKKQNSSNIFSTHQPLNIYPG